MNRPCDCDEDVGYNAHKHRCPCCGKCWTHSDEMLDAPLDVLASAHSSPCCNVSETDKVMDERQIEKAAVFLRFGVQHNGN